MAKASVRGKLQWVLLRMSEIVRAHQAIKTAQDNAMAPTISGIATRLGKSSRALD